MLCRLIRIQLDPNCLHSPEDSLKLHTGHKHVFLLPQSLGLAQVFDRDKCQSPLKTVCIWNGYFLETHSPGKLTFLLKKKSLQAPSLRRKMKCNPRLKEKIYFFFKKNILSLKQTTHPPQTNTTTYFPLVDNFETLSGKSKLCC